MNKPLQKGDTIGIAAPGSFFERSEFEKGCRTLHELGFHTWYREDIFAREHYLAGTDERRASELHELFTRQEIKAIMFARGGYGVQRILPILDLKLLQKNPKIVLGYSDLTAFLCLLEQQFHFPVFYGPVLTQLARDPQPSSKTALVKALCSHEPLGEMPLEESRSFKAGKARGKLVGGCLTILATSLGTAYEINTDESILFLEDVDEDVYAMDRFLTQLKHAGKFKNVHGILFGKTLPRDADKYNFHEMLKNVFADFTGPIVTDYPCGHTQPFLTLPFGQQASLEAEAAGKISFIIHSGPFS